MKTELLPRGILLENIAQLASRGRFQCGRGAGTGRGGLTSRLKRGIVVLGGFCCRMDLAFLI